MPFKKVSHVIFDMDGLIIGNYLLQVKPSKSSHWKYPFIHHSWIPESESAYDRVVSEIGAPFGSPYTTDIKIKILGTPEPDTAKIAIQEMGLPYTVDEFLEIYRAKVKEQLQHPPLMPGRR